MHELSLCHELLVLVERAVEGQSYQRILAVYVEIGAFTCIEPSALEFCFDAAKKDSLARDSQLVIVKADAMGECPQCGNSQIMQDRFEVCAKCEYFPVSLSFGDDMVLKSVEVE